MQCKKKLEATARNGTLLVLELSASFEPKVMSLHLQKTTKNNRLLADSLLQGLYLIKQALQVSCEQLVMTVNSDSQICR